jgi:hypothetical protein
MARPIDIDSLLAEIARYLAAVDAFRAAGCAPQWRLEPLGTGATTRL